MARLQTTGLSYFPFDAAFFLDRQIKQLRGRFGCDGPMLYIFLLGEIYRCEGYYMKFDRGAADYLAAELGISLKKVKDITGYLLDQAFFSRELFEREQALSSADIQLQYAEAVKMRAKRVSVSVDKRFWLPSRSETPDYIVFKNDNSSEKNDDSSEKKADSSVKNETKEKKSKENKSKEKDSKEKKEYAPCVLLTKEEHQKLIGDYGAKQTQAMIDKLSAFKLSGGKRYLSDYSAILSWVVDWYQSGRAKDRPGRGKTGEASFDSNKLSDSIFENQYTEDL